MRDYLVVRPICAICEKQSNTGGLDKMITAPAPMPTAIKRDLNNALVSSIESEVVSSV